MYQNITLYIKQDSRAKKDGTAQLSIIAYCNAWGGNKRTQIKTGICVRPEHWRKNKQCVWKDAFYSHHNRKLLRMQTEILDYIQDRQRKNPNDFITRDDVQNYKQAPQASSTFQVFYKEQMELSTNTKSTKETKRQTLELLTAYKRVIYFRDLTYPFVKAFVAFLDKRGLAESTIYEKHLKNLKTGIKEAIKYGYIKAENDPFLHIKLKTVQGTRECLTPEQVHKLENLVLPPDAPLRLRMAKDAFLFSCYTGLRVSDLLTLNMSNIIERPQGLLAQCLTQKTRKHKIEVKLHLWELFEGKPEKILKRYLAEYGDFYDDPLKEDQPRSIFFEFYNEEKNIVRSIAYNKLLKQLAKLARLGGWAEQGLSSHIGRHTCGTMLALAGVNEKTIGLVLGQKKASTTARYIHMAEEIAGNGLKAANWQRLQQAE